MRAAVNSSHPPIGTLLREWRAARRMSQLELALEAGMSARHLSCVETGKSQASRETVGRLAHALGMPLREHNLLMLAAGFAPQFSETPLCTSALGRMNDAVELILRHHEPYPAFVINRYWDVLLTAGTIFFLYAGRWPALLGLLVLGQWTILCFLPVFDSAYYPHVRPLSPH